MTCLLCTGWLRRPRVSATFLLPCRQDFSRVGSGTNHRLSFKRQLSTNRNSKFNTDGVHSNRVRCTDNDNTTTSQRGPIQQVDNDSSLLERYESLIQRGEITRDIHQLEALKELNRLREECMSCCDTDQAECNKVSTIFFTQLFSLSSSPSWADTTTVTPTPGLPRGVYLHGGVGCGKTFCMNMFYNSLPPAIEKQKVHFLQFMLNVHKQMHLAKMKNLLGDAAIEYVIQSTISNGKILCFDEFQVTDVADGKLVYHVVISFLRFSS